MNKTLSQYKATLASTTGRIRDVFRRQDGAVDLGSIMVGAIVLGVLTGAVLATVFMVIPWSQDNAAQQKVSQIVSAQTAYYAMSSDNGGTKGPHYGILADLTGKNLLAGDVTTGGKVLVQAWNAVADGTATSTGSVHTGVPTTVNTSRDAFVVSVQSDTGAVYYATSENPQPKKKGE